MFDFFSWEGDLLIYTKKLEIEPNDAEKFTIIHKLSVEYHYSLLLAKWRKKLLCETFVNKGVRNSHKKIDKKHTRPHIFFFKERTVFGKVDETRNIFV